MPKPNGTLEMKKTSDEEKEEEGQGPVEETETKKGPKVKKGKAYEADPEKQVEKGDEECQQNRHAQPPVPKCF